jgi:hypothetical protein
MRLKPTMNPKAGAPSKAGRKPLAVNSQISIFSPSLSGPVLEWPMILMFEAEIVSSLYWLSEPHIAALINQSNR